VKVSLDLSFVAAAIAGILLALQGARAFGADELKPQQQRMRTCNTQADRKGLENGERNHFMRSCLKGKQGKGHQLTARQQRSEECTRQAKEQKLEGAERRGFMSECEKPPVKQKTAETEKMKSCAKRAAERRLEGKDRENYLNGCRNAASASAGQEGS
jgi:hypothetical protein